MQNFKSYQEYGMNYGVKNSLYQQPYHFLSCMHKSPYVILKRKWYVLQGALICVVHT